MLHGNLWKSLWRFTVPIMLINVIQLLFNASDMIVVGKFVGDTALAAVGTTTSFFHLFFYFYTGIAVGVNVVVARDYGAGEGKGIVRSIHTALPLATIIGAVCTVGGILSAPAMLAWLNVPSEVLPGAILYVRICFAGAVPTAIYHCCAAVLRSYGDSKRPMYFLLLSGVVNVILNLIFVAVFHWGVAGVAAATSIAQVVSAVLAFVTLLRRKDVFGISLPKIRLDRRKSREMIRYGLPSALQKMSYSFCNFFIQARINQFGTDMMAGHTAAANLCTFIEVSMTSWSDAVITFVGQNVGAGKDRRCLKILRVCIISVFVVGAAMGVIFYLLRRPLLSLYTEGDSSMAYGELHMLLLCLPYFLYGLVTVICGFMQGLGYPMRAMIANLAGICGIRIMWLLLVFPWKSTPFCLYLSYPVSWSVTLLLSLVLSIFCYRKFQERLRISEAAKQVTELPPPAEN